MSEAGPSRPRHHPTTPAEQQAAVLSQLLAHPEREVKLPSAPREKTLRAPRETIKNVTGSSAGAGSGEFHVYKHARRREYERIKLMEEKDVRDKEESRFLIEQAELQARDEAKTGKNRGKREKKKAARERAKAAKSAATGNSSGAATPGEKRKRSDQGASATTNGEKIAAGEKRMRAAPGTESIAFKAKDDDDDDEEDNDEEDA